MEILLEKYLELNWDHCRALRTEIHLEMHQVLY
jgi:hypothetical protein